MDKDSIRKLNDELEAKAIADRRAVVSACKALTTSDVGVAFLEIARAHFNVDAPRFQRSADGRIDHDIALIKDGQAEVFYWIDAMASLHQDL